MSEIFFISGSIGSGKSSFISYISRKGYKSLNADTIAHELLHAHAKQIALLFDDESLVKNELVDRKKLGDLVFNDAGALKKLEKFLHPKIKERILKEIEIYQKLAATKPLFIEMPLFFENNTYKNLGKSVLIYAPKESLIKRIMQRNSLSYDEALKRINLQMDIEEKKNLADFIVYNDEDEKSFYENCEKFLRSITSVKFYKYYANGNDFIIYKDEGKKDRSELAKRLCDRHLGIGADGLIAILPHEKFAFEWDFYNCDGSRANMCGNGSRAAAHFANYFLNLGREFSFLTGAGVIEAKIKDDEVEVKLGRVKKLDEDFEEEGFLWSFYDSGVPHLVCFCKSVDEFDEARAKKLRHKYNANVNFVQICQNDVLKVRTFERGVEAETLACGTGMAASFFVANLKGFVASNAFVYPKSEERVQMRLVGDEVFFKAKVRWCFEADFNFS